MSAVGHPSLSHPTAILECMDVYAHRRTVSGLDLRYLLTWLLVEGGTLTVGELARRLEADGFGVAMPVSKTLSDALRWEVRRGRVVRVGRGRYGPGAMPRQTRSRIRCRVAALRRHAVAA